MKTILLSLFFAFAINTINAQEFSAMTFNIRYDNPTDGVNSWENRKESVVNLIRYYAPQILGTQEGLANQLDFLQSKLPAYKYIGVGREDGKQKGEHCAIFYDTTKFQVVKSATFWLSDKSDTVSVGWDAALERICTYGLFQNVESGKKCLIFNTHFDHMGAIAQKMSALLMVKMINRLNPEKYPIILMGDFNVTIDSEPIKTLKSHFSEVSDVSKNPIYGPDATFNSFNPNNVSKDCIDFMFTNILKVISCAHIDDRRKDNGCISDHYPVLVKFYF